VFISQAAWYHLPSCLLNGPLGLVIDVMNIHDVYGLAAWKHNDGWTNKLPEGGNNWYLFPV